MELKQELVKSVVIRYESGEEVEICLDKWTIEVSYTVHPKGQTAQMVRRPDGGMAVVTELIEMPHPFEKSVLAFG